MSIYIKKLLNAELNVLKNILGNCVSDIERLAEIIQESKGKTILTGIGKSGIIAHKISATLSSIGITSIFINSAEALHGDLGMVEKGDVVIMISNSGKTAELLSMIPSLERIGVTLTAIIGNLSVELKPYLDHYVLTSCEVEGDNLNIAPMSSAMGSLAIGDAVAAHLQKVKKCTLEQFALYHPSGNLGKKMLNLVEAYMVKKGDFGVLGENASVVSIAQTLTKYPVGLVCITSKDGILRGVVTDGDLRRWIPSLDYTITSSKLMSENPVTISKSSRIIEVLGLLRKTNKKVNQVVVCERGVPIGVLNLQEVLK